jgi:hypothetical protein
MEKSHKKNHMKKTVLSVTALSLGLLSLASGCSVETASSETNAVASTEESLICSNPDGVNAWMAALAVSTAQEMNRWDATHDFWWRASTDRLELTYYGKARCDDNICFNTQQLLNMQGSAANGLVTFPGGVKLNTSVLHDRLKAAFQKQIDCENAHQCPAGNGNDLRLVKFAKGACDTVFTFNATSSDGVTLLPDPGLLANHLLWAGYTGKSDTNPYLAFQSTGTTVSVDPTVGLNEGDATTSGSCTAACTLVSSTSVAGQCCACNGATKNFSRSPFSSGVYLCR